MYEIASKRTMRDLVYSKGRMPESMWYFDLSIRFDCSRWISCCEKQITKEKKKSALLLLINLPENFHRSHIHLFVTILHIIFFVSQISFVQRLLLKRIFNSQNIRNKYKKKFSEIKIFESFETVQNDFFFFMSMNCNQMSLYSKSSTSTKFLKQWL